MSTIISVIIIIIIIICMIMIVLIIIISSSSRKVAGTHWAVTFVGWPYLSDASCLVRPPLISTA